MNKSAALDRSPVPASADKAMHAPLGDDNAMLKAAAGLTRDLNVARPAIYWADMLGSALLGYAALAAAIATGSTIVALISGLIAVLALYRAGSFIHEITHMKPNAVPGFYWAWNALVGVPLLVPSFMYEGVHNQHHAKTYYGTAEDPEYLPLALMHPWTLPVFLIAAALAPIGMLIRFGLLAPLSLLLPKLRETVVAKLFRAADQSPLPPTDARPANSGAMGDPGSRSEPLGDCAHCPGRDRDHSAARLPDLPGHLLWRDVPQPDPHPGRASVGK